MKKLNVGLLGLGTVGTGVYNIFNMNGKKINYAAGKELHILKILEKNKSKEKELSLSPGILTDDPDLVLTNPDIDIIIEVLGGIHPAYEFIKIALENKKHVVTANKALIATHGKELLKIANENQVALRYEASVGGGIPIINTLSNALNANEFEEIVGIVNGTTNYILTQMTDYGFDYSEVLKIAQEKGFAEADPTSDVEGEDAAYKLSILMTTIFGVEVDPMDIPREGITKISKDDIEYASQFGYKIKLLATARKLKDKLVYHVHPTLIPKNHPLASVSNEFNALFIKGNAVGELMLYGKGAGSLPTGSAIIGDVIEIAKIIGTDFNPCISIPEKNQNLQLSGEDSSKYYIHFRLEDKPGALGTITTAFGENGISIETIMQKSRGEQYVPVIFILHECTRQQLDKTLNQIVNYDAVKEIRSILGVRQN